MLETSRLCSPRALLIVLASFLLGSCASSLTLSLSPDGSGILAVDAGIPETTAARLQSFRSVAADAGAGEPAAPFFDARAIRAQSEARGLSAITAETPTPHRFRGSFSMRSVSDAVSDPELSKAGLIALTTSGGESTLSFSISRENAQVLPVLFPGMDPYILEALSPPALDPYPVTAEEYREMLAALLGQAALKELASAAVQLQIRTPGPITRSSGGKLSGGQSFTASLPLLELLVLEKPLSFSVSWR